VILLDTHVALWLALDPAQISQPAVSAIERAQKENRAIALSCVSLYEIARLVHRGRVQLDGSTEGLLDQLSAQLSVIALTHSIALIAARLPSDFPGDPMDRVIAGTALAEKFALITADRRIRTSRAVKTIW
jgi:PIN domain nuclease of toxin-antitoxin system